MFCLQLRFSAADNLTRQVRGTTEAKLTFNFGIRQDASSVAVRARLRRPTGGSSNASVSLIYQCPAVAVDCQTKHQLRRRGTTLDPVAHAILHCIRVVCLRRERSMLSCDLLPASVQVIAATTATTTGASVTTCVQSRDQKPSFITMEIVICMTNRADSRD